MKRDAEPRPQAKHAFRPHGNSPSTRHFTNWLLLFNVLELYHCFFVPSTVFLSNSGKVFFNRKKHPQQRSQNCWGTEAVNSHNTPPYLMYSATPAPMIMTASTQASIPGGSKAHIIIPTPKVNAATPTVFAKQRIEITAFHQQYIHKSQLLLIYINKKVKGCDCHKTRNDHDLHSLLSA